MSDYNRLDKRAGGLGDLAKKVVPATLAATGLVAAGKMYYTPTEELKKSTGADGSSPSTGDGGSSFFSGLTKNEAVPWLLGGLGTGGALGLGIWLRNRARAEAERRQAEQAATRMENFDIVGKKGEGYFREAMTGLGQAAGDVISGATSTMASAATPDRPIEVVKPTLLAGLGLGSAVGAYQLIRYLQKKTDKKTYQNRIQKAKQGLNQALLNEQSAVKAASDLFDTLDSLRGGNLHKVACCCNQTKLAYASMYEKLLAMATLITAAAGGVGMYHGYNRNPDLLKAKELPKAKEQYEAENIDSKAPAYFIPQEAPGKKKVTDNLTD